RATGKVRADRLPQCLDLLRPRDAGTIVREILSIARAGRVSGPRQGRDAVGSNPPALRARGRARANLSPFMRDTSTEVLVKVADYAVAASGTIATIGLGSCVAIILYDGVAHVGGMAHVLLPNEAMSRDR